MKYKFVKLLNKNISKNQLEAIIIDVLLTKNNSTNISKGIIKFRKKSSGTRILHLYKGEVFKYETKSNNISLYWRLQSKLLIGYNFSIFLGFLGLYIQNIIHFKLLVILTSLFILFNTGCFYMAFKFLVKGYCQSILDRLLKSKT